MKLLEPTEKMEPNAREQSYSENDQCRDVAQMYDDRIYGARAFDTVLWETERKDGGRDAGYDGYGQTARR
jgi:hypothetical protein